MGCNSERLKTFSKVGSCQNNNGMHWLKLHMYYYKYNSFLLNHLVYSQVTITDNLSDFQSIKYRMNTKTESR